MRIAILHSGDLKTISLGGVDRYIKGIILFCADYEITVFGTSAAGEHVIGKRYIKEYCDKKYYFIPIIDDGHYPLSIRYMYRLLRWISRLKEYDCIYAQRTEYSVPFLFSKARNRLIQMIHGSSRYSEIFWGKRKARIHLFFERLGVIAARKTFIILNREEFGVPYYKLRYERYKDRFLYGKNPIDSRIYHPIKKEEARRSISVKNDSKVVLYSGRIENVPKRVNLLPRICKKVKDTYAEITFIVIGDGNDREELIAAINKEGLANNFIIPGYIDDPNIIAKYNASADICINLSMFEGTCTSLLEAIACGTPVLATDVGDVREVVHNGYNGLLVQNDMNEDIIVEAFSSRIIQLLCEGCNMDESVKKYDGAVVIRELKEVIVSLQKKEIGE